MGLSELKCEPGIFTAGAFNALWLEKESWTYGNNGPGIDFKLYSYKPLTKPMLILYFI